MSAPPPPPDLAGLTLLVVNDDINTGEIVASFLRACEATVLSAEAVAAALAYLDESRKADAVVADIATPGIVELAWKLRHDPRRNRLPIVRSHRPLGPPQSARV